MNFLGFIIKYFDMKLELNFNLNEKIEQVNELIFDIYHSIVKRYSLIKNIKLEVSFWNIMIIFI